MQSTIGTVKHGSRRPNPLWGAIERSINFDQGDASQHGSTGTEAQE